MKNKIIGILGLLCILASILGFFAYSNTIKNDSELFGKTVLVLTQDVEAGQPLDSTNMTLKRVKINDLQSSYLEETDLNKIKGQVAAIKLFKNEQVSLYRLTKASSFQPETSQLVALDITTVNSLAGNIKEGDIVTLWDYKTEGNLATKKLGNVKIIAIKDAQNQNVKDVQGAVPVAIIVQLDNEEQIKIAKSITNLFVSKNENQLKASYDSVTILAQEEEPIDTEIKEKNIESIDTELKEEN